MLRWFLNGENTEETIADDQLATWYQDGQDVESETGGEIEAEEYLEQEIISYIEGKDSRKLHFVLLSADPLYWSHFHFNCNGED